MSGYRKKPNTVANIEAFGNDMSAIFKTLNRYQTDLYTGGEHYLALVDLHIQLCKTTLTITGESELTWVARARGYR